MSISKQLVKVRSLGLNPREEWVIGRKSVDITIEELGEQIKPELLICASITSELVISSNVVAPGCADSEIVSWTLGCMLSPMAGKPQRPAAVALTGGGLNHLKAVLEELGIEVSVSSLSHPLVDEMVSEFEQTFSSPGVPPYLAEAVAPETVADFFFAATEFHRLKPWKLLEFEIPVKIGIQARQSTDYWAIVMGAVGLEHGLAMYNSLEALSNLFDAESEAEANKIAESTYSLAFTYMAFDEIGPTAQAECLSYGWAMADESAYPSAIVIDPNGRELGRRPSEKELRDLTVATRALVYLFATRERLIRQEGMVDCVLDLEISGKRLPVSIIFPAPEFLIG